MAFFLLIFLIIQIFRLGTHHTKIIFSTPENSRRAEIIKHQWKKIHIYIYVFIWFCLMVYPN